MWPGPGGVQLHLQADSAIMPFVASNWQELYIIVMIAKGAINQIHNMSVFPQRELGICYPFNRSWLMFREFVASQFSWDVCALI